MTVSLHQYSLKLTIFCVHITKLTHFPSTSVQLMIARYPTDNDCLHRMENPSQSDSAVSLHLYVPPYDTCKSFDERTGFCISVGMPFWSEYGQRIQVSAATYLPPSYLSIVCAVCSDQLLNSIYTRTISLSKYGLHFITLYNTIFAHFQCFKIK